MAKKKPDPKNTAITPEAAAEAIASMNKKTLDPKSLSGRVFAALEKSATSADALMELTQSEMKQIRNSITALRRRFPAGSEFHPVAFEGRYWFARDLEAKGYELVESRGGNLKVDKGDAPVSEKNAEDVLREVLGDKPLSPENVTAACTQQLEVVDWATKKLQEARKHTREIEGGREAAHRDVMEEPCDPNDPAAVMEKYVAMIQTWQDLEEAKAECIEIRKLHRGTLKEQGRKLRAMMKAAKALGIVEAIEDSVHGK